MSDAKSPGGRLQALGIEVGRRFMALPHDAEAGEVHVASGVGIPIPSPMRSRALPQTVDFAKVYHPFLLILTPS